MLNESNRVLLLTPDRPWNPHKIAFFEIEENMLDVEGGLVEKKDKVRTMIQETVSSERIEREEVAGELEMKLIDKLCYQESCGNKLVC